MSTGAIIFLCFYFVSGIWACYVVRKEHGRLPIIMYPLILLGGAGITVVDILTWISKKLPKV